MADKMLSQVHVLSNVLKLSYYLKKNIPNIEFIDIKPNKNEELLQEAEIIVTDFDLIAPHLNNLKKAKWVQGTWAGVDYLINNLTNKNFPFPITRFSGGSYFGSSMAEYTIAQIVSYERNFHQMYANQKAFNWNHDGKISNHRLLSDLTIGILGTGTIGMKIASGLNFFNAKILALKKDISIPTPDCIEKFYSLIDLPEMISQSDYLINVLPSTKDTKDLLDGDLLYNCLNRKTIFINIGRGTIISEQSLLKALDKKWIGGAILDVFQKEPLPLSSRLWNYPGVIISPHVSGVSRPDQIAEFFIDNYNLFIKNLPLKNIIVFENEY